jgi:hypothetical protein
VECNHYLEKLLSDNGLHMTVFDCLNCICIEMSANSPLFMWFITNHQPPNQAHLWVCLYVFLALANTLSKISGL